MSTNPIDDTIRWILESGMMSGHEFLKVNGINKAKQNLYAAIAAAVEDKKTIAPILESEYHRNFVIDEALEIIAALFDIGGEDA